MPVSIGDGLEPSPEYIAARDAALKAAIAKKKAKQATPVPGASGPTPGAAAPGQPAAAMSPQRVSPAPVAPALQSAPAAPRDPAAPVGPAARPSLRRSYADAVAALGDSALDDIYGDDDDDVASSVGPRAGYAPSQPWQSGAESGPIPGRTGAIIPIERNPVRMGIGGLIIAAGLFLLLFYLPGHAPGGDAPRARPAVTDLDAPPPARIWRFSDSLYPKAQAVAGGFLVVGALFIISGFMFRHQAEVVCRVCDRYVIAEKDGIWLKCPRSSHQAAISYQTVALVVGLVLCVAGTVVCIALGNIVRGG